MASARVLFLSRGSGRWRRDDLRDDGPDSKSLLVSGNSALRRGSGQTPPVPGKAKSRIGRVAGLRVGRGRAWRRCAR